MLKSSNFWTNVVTLILGILKAWGASVDTTGVEIIDAISMGNVTIIAMIAVNLINPIRKIIANKAWEDLAFLKSRNFITNAVTVILSVLTIATGSEIPADAANPIADAISGGDVGMIISAVALNVVNHLVHLFDKKEEVAPFEVAPAIK